jgi:transposase
MTRKRRTYTDEFKADAVKLLTEQGYTLAEASRSLGVHANLLRKWREQSQAAAAGGASAKNVALNGEERDELRRLRAENKRLLMEREILKKAAAFFANEKS